MHPFQKVCQLEYLSIPANHEWEPNEDYLQQYIVRDWRKRYWKTIDHHCVIPVLASQIKEFEAPSIHTNKIDDNNICLLSFYSAM